MLTFVSCSGNKKANEAKDEKSVELDADFIVDSEDEDLEVDDETEAEGEEEISMDDAEEEFSEGGDEEPVIAEEEQASEPVQIADSPEPVSGGTYTVKKGETLMWIAFKIYGDYSKWSDLSRENGNVVSLREGQVLNYTEPANQFNWNPRGNPHTIARGETLGIISNDKYGTPSKWRSIYENNRPMIKNPNLIFAGFTLYYIPGRDLASE